MTASPHARGASVPVHDLSQSSVGTAASFVPVKILPPSFTSLGDAAADVAAKLAGRRTVDAVQIATKEADSTSSDDGELLSLIAQHGPALAKWAAADDAADLVRDAYWKVEPARPNALYGRLWDGTFPRSGLEQIEGSTSMRTFYTDNDVQKLRAAPEPMTLSTGRADSLEGGDLAWRPDPRSIARKTEILAASDVWEAEKDRLRETTGLNAANAICKVIGLELSRIEDAILDYTPRTFEGLQAKARWIASTPMAKEGAEHLMHDLCRMPAVAIPSSRAERVLTLLGIDWTKDQWRGEDIWPLPAATATEAA